MEPSRFLKYSAVFDPESLTKAINPSSTLHWRNQSVVVRLGKRNNWGYMGCIWFISDVISAVKTNDYVLYSHSLFRMIDPFFICNGQNYARYIIFFSIVWANVDETHPGARTLPGSNVFRVARFLIQWKKCPVEKPIEKNIYETHLSLLP